MTHYGSLQLPQRRRYLPKRKRTWALIIFLLLLVAAGISFYLLYSTPGWYRPRLLSEPDIDLTADKAQVRFLELGNRAQNSVFAEHTWSITQDEVNAFLAVSTPRISSSSHGDISDPMVLFTPGQITFCARSSRLPSRDAKGGVLSLSIKATTVPPDPTTTTQPGNQLHIAVDGLWLGQFPIPPSLIQNRLNAAFPSVINAVRQAMLRELTPQQVEENLPLVIDWLDHARRGEPFHPKLPKGRKFSIKEIRVTPGKLTITFGPR